MISSNSAKIIYLNNSASRNANLNSCITTDLQQQQAIFNQTQYNVCGKGSDMVHNPNAVKSDKADKSTKKKQYLIGQNSHQALPIASSFVLGGATAKLKVNGNNSTLFAGDSGKIIQNH